MLAYTSTHHILANYGVIELLSEVHGILSARFCFQSDFSCEHWLKEYLDEEHDALKEADQEAEIVLTDLYEQTKMQFLDDFMSFELLLPEDNMPIQTRVRALGQWCTGFLFGLGVNHNQVDVSDTIRELIIDFQKVARNSNINLLVEEDDLEETENSLQELIEYIRVGVQYIFEELQLNN